MPSMLSRRNSQHQTPCAKDPGGTRLQKNSHSEARDPFIMSRPVYGAIFAASGASGEAGERPEDPRKAIVHQVDYGATRVKPVA